MKKVKNEGSPNVVMGKPFRNSFNVVLPEGEINGLPSVTQPSMALSLKQLLKRYTRGGEVATFSPQYQQTDDFEDQPDVSKMDATERLQYALDLKMEIKRYQQRLAEARNIPSPDPKPQTKPEGRPEGETSGNPDGNNGAP